MLRRGANVAWRWDPVAGDWVHWYLAAEAPKEEHPRTDRTPAVAVGTGGQGQAAAVVGKVDAPTGTSPTAALTVAETYAKSIDKYRDNVKWFVVAAGAVAVALIGSAPLSGSSASLSSSGWNRAAFGLFAALASIAGILLLAAWTLQPMEMSLPYLAKRPWLGILPMWKRKFQTEYRRHWVNLLDGRATSLNGFSAYRDCWLGTVSDIDELLLQGAAAWRSRKLLAYRKVAQLRIADDTPNVGLLLKRGIARRTRRRGQVALSLILVLSIAAAAGYLVYLGGAGMPPIITGLHVNPDPPGSGDLVQVTVEATGSGFAYAWWHEPSIDPIDGANGPTLTISTTPKQMLVPTACGLSHRTGPAQMSKRSGSPPQTVRPGVVPCQGACH